MTPSVSGEIKGRAITHEHILVESEEELKTLLERVKERVKKLTLKLSIQKTDQGIWSHH